MIVSKSNCAKDAVITVTPASDGQDIEVVTDNDYSSAFTQQLSGSNIEVLFTFSTPRKLDYIAIGGSNALRIGDIKLEVNSAIEPWEYTINKTGDSQVIMKCRETREVSSVKVTFIGNGSLLVSEIAMGEGYEIPQGEQSGYARPWTVPNIKSRGAVSLNGSPISLTYESRVLACTLTVPNNVMEDFSNWYEFINFAAKNTFYVCEDYDLLHSYAGFNLMPDMTKAHSSTRKLGVSTVKFNAYAKSTEGIFV